MEDKIQEACPSKTVVKKGIAVRIPAIRSPVGQKFKDIPSQMKDSNQSKAVEMATEDPEPTLEEPVLNFDDLLASMP